MKSPLLPHLAWGTAVAAAFVAGSFIAGPAAPAPSPQPPSVTDATAVLAHDEKPESPAADHAAASGRPAVLSGQEAKVQTFQLLCEPSRVARMSALCELLTHLSKDNWRDVLAGCVRQTQATGRRHDEEWFLMLERVGEVAGADALGEKGVTGRNQIRAVLTGFAARDSQAAIDWFNQQPEDAQDGMIDTLIEGVGRHDAKLAIEIALKEPQEVWEPAMVGVIAAEIQREGFPKADEFLRDIQRRTDVPSTMKGKVFLEFANRRLFVAAVDKAPAETLVWFDQYLGADSIAGPSATRNIIGRAAAADPVATLDWVEQRAGRLDENQATAAYEAVARAFLEKDPDQFATWMTSHPEHPRHDTLASAIVASSLRDGDLDQARQWLATVRDAALRAPLEQKLKKSEGAPAQ